MPPNRPHLWIDARPRTSRGPLAVEQVQGRPVLDHQLDLADSLTHPNNSIFVLVHPEDQLAVAIPLASRPPGRFTLTFDLPNDLDQSLSTNRLYDAPRLRKALNRAQTPESAVIWRLDHPNGLKGADDELTRRQSYQPLGRYWALSPARALARALAPTPIRPNAVTLAASALMLAASALVAFAPASLPINVLTAFALASALVLDTADGHLARLQGTASPFGRWLDAWLDELCDMALHAAIAWSAFILSGSPVWLLLGMLYAMSKYVYMVGSTGPTPETATPSSSPRSASLPTTLIRLAGHADIRWHLWIILAALGRLDAALAAYAVYFPLRAVSSAVKKGVRRA